MRPDADRAIALCWLCHLVADGHQPCHAGSLYAAGIYPDGDRGGNSIKIGPKGNLHATWDGLLGGSATANDVRKRVVELQSDKVTTAKIDAQRESFGPGKWIDAESWLSESRDLGRRFVYTSELVEPVTSAMRGLTKEVELTKLSDGYYENAGRIARIRAIQSGRRLAEVLNAGLTK